MDVRWGIDGMTVGWDLRIVRTGERERVEVDDPVCVGNFKAGKYKLKLQSFKEKVLCDFDGLIPN